MPIMTQQYLTAALQWGIFVVCIEWTVFVCTHTMGSQWKQAFGAAPWWVKAVMENGKRLCLTTTGSLYFKDHLCYQRGHTSLYGHFPFLLATRT